MSLPTEKEAISVRKYFVEYTVLFLLAAVITLFGLYYNLNEFVTKTLMEDKLRAERIIERNTDVISYLKTNKNN